MKIIQNIYECAVCHHKSTYDDILSYARLGYPDFDGKPKDASLISLGIKECPHCHYANYDITKTISPLFMNNLELWQKDKKAQELLKIQNNDLRKILLIAWQYQEEKNYYNAYQMYLKASWVCDNKDDEKAYRYEALRIFDEHILKNLSTEIIRFSETLRLEGYFKDARDVLDCFENIFDEKEKEVCEKIKKYITSQDTKRHNLEEILG